MIQREIYEFGPYSLDSAQMLLRRAGNVVQLQPRALETLLVLVRRRGEVVSKQELMDSVWPDSFVEEGNLTQNIFLLRRELGKTPEGEEYIQTLPKRGYRMNMPVSHSKYSAGEQGNADSGSEIAAIDSSPASAVDAKAVPAMHSARWYGRQSWLVAAWPLLAMLAVLAFGIAAIVFWRIASARPKVSGYGRITHDGAMKRGNADHVGGPDAALFADGSRVYFMEGSSDAPWIAEVSASGGETGRVTIPFPLPELMDFSPVRSELLVGRTVDEAGPLQCGRFRCRQARLAASEISPPGMLRGRRMDERLSMPEAESCIEPEATEASRSCWRSCRDWDGNRAGHRMESGCD